MTTIAGKAYQFIIASDIQRNGLGLELWDHPQTEILAEIFRNDSTKCIELYVDKKGVPLEAIEELIRRFDTHVGRIFQG